MHRLERTDLRDPDYEPEYWYDDEDDKPNKRLMLDHDNHPIKKWKDLPATLSSLIEGFAIEAYCRIDSRISRMDIRARMPSHIEAAGGRMAPQIGLAAIGNRRDRFRIQNGLVSWDKRVGSDAITSYITSKLSTEDIVNNTTRGLKGLSKQEQNEVANLNKGRNMARAGGKVLTEGLKLERERKAAVKKTRAPRRTRKSLTGDETEDDSRYQDAGPSGRGSRVTSGEQAAGSNLHFKPQTPSTERANETQLRSSASVVDEPWTQPPSGIHAASPLADPATVLTLMTPAQQDDFHRKYTRWLQSNAGSTVNTPLKNGRAVLLRPVQEPRELLSSPLIDKKVFKRSDPDEDRMITDDEQRRRDAYQEEDEPEDIVPPRKKFRSRQQRLAIDDDEDAEDERIVLPKRRIPRGSRPGRRVYQQRNMSSALTTTPGSYMMTNNSLYTPQGRLSSSPDGHFSGSTALGTPPSSLDRGGTLIGSPGTVAKISAAPSPCPPGYQDIDSIYTSPYANINASTSPEIYQNINTIDFENFSTGPQNASTSPQSPFTAHPPIDFRTLPPSPSYPTAAYNIQSALQATRTDFEGHFVDATGKPTVLAPVTNQWMSYWEQYAQIQAAFERAFGERNERNGWVEVCDRVPQLRWLMRWEGGWEGWMVEDVSPLGG